MSSMGRFVFAALSQSFFFNDNFLFPVHIHVSISINVIKNLYLPIVKLEFSLAETFYIITFL